MTVLSWLKEFPYKAWNPGKPDGQWSTSDLIRACRDGAVLLHNRRVDSREEMQYPVTGFVFFPGSKRRTTIF